MTSTFKPEPGTVYFIGAGPGAPDLITVRGQNIIAQADTILYADSLVAESVAQLAHRPDAKIVGSSGLHLEQILDLMVDAVHHGQVVARIHSGDPALYGAIHEQMAYLEDYNIPYEIIPGVTAAFAAAARLKTELTVPDVVQTIIMTRTAGRTTMPPGEELRTLAAPGASLAIYLSITRMRQVVDDLLASGGYALDTPVAVLHKVTWPDESLVIGTLANIVDKVRAAGYTKHALILVSPALNISLKGENRRTSSHLYNKNYTHRFRRAVDFKRGQRSATTTENGIRTDKEQQDDSSAYRGSVVIAVTRPGSELATRLARHLDAEVALPAKFSQSGNGNPPEFKPYPDSVLAEVRRRWPGHNRLILVMPTGIAVRAIAPLISHKSTDPAVVCLDEAGQSIIPLLGGHQAGANTLARKIAAFTGGHAAITTASDVQGKPALDLPPTLANGQRWYIDPNSALTHAAASMVNEEPVAIYLDPHLQALRPQVEAWLGQLENSTWVDSLDLVDLDSYTAGLIISHRRLSDRHQHLLAKSVHYIPSVLVVGIGLQRDTPTATLKAALETALAEADLNPNSVGIITSVDLKAAEPGLQTLAAERDTSLEIVSSEELVAAFPANSHGAWPNFSPSAAQQKFNLPGVAEPCALWVAGKNGQLIVPKRSFECCTIAIAVMGGERIDGGL